VVSIGPQTSQACREVLGRLDAEANPYDLDGLVAACSALFTGSESAADSPA
jgi:uroporphyrinogen-III synthase